MVSHRRQNKKKASFQIKEGSDVLDPQVVLIASEYYASLDCPRALTAQILLRYGEWSELVNLRARPIDYAYANEYHLAALASDWLRKYPGIPGYSDELRQGAAEKVWIDAEVQCYKTNKRLQGEIPPEFGLILDVAATYCGKLLGRLPTTLTPSFGPGATMSDPSRASTIIDKVSSSPTVTEDARCLLTMWQGTAWERSHFALCERSTDRSYDPKVVEGNEFFTVPKDATVFRGCAKGPSLNVAYQLAAGKAIRDNLARNFSYDLAHRQEHHQNLAARASLEDGHVTIDCKSASDTIAYRLVELLLQKSEWWDILDTLRERKTLFKGTQVHLQKFSAMGNGFTFELETIIFLSICLAVCWAVGEDDPDLLLATGDITVYGDDIIVPKNLSVDLIAVLNFCGFTVNENKTFVKGAFRESCGGDFFNGHAVNTAKLENELTDPGYFFSCHNILKARFVDRYPVKTRQVVVDDYGRVIHSKRGPGANLLEIVKKQLPVKYRTMYGPKHLGDSVLHGVYNHLVRQGARFDPSVGACDPNQLVGTLRVLRPVLRYAQREDYHPSAQLAYALYVRRDEDPARRPLARKTRIDHHEDSLDVILEDAPHQSPTVLHTVFRRYFGVDE